MSDLFGNPESKRYPDAPGHRGVETSEEAAQALAPKCGRLQRLTLEAIGQRGATGFTFEEAANDLELDFRSIQPRISELRSKGLVVDSGQRRRNASGKRAIVWTLPEYREAARA
jgi:hypothetical protein